MRVKPSPSVKLDLPITYIRQGRAANDSYSALADDALAPAQGDVIVSLPRFAREAESLLDRDGKTGVKIAAGEAIEEIAPYLPRLDLIAVEFPKFRDGRGYTTARLARERYKFEGELRALGDVLIDQVFFMLRCGFDAFELKAKDGEAAFARAARSFSQVYQPAADGRRTAIEQRRAEG